MSKGVLIENGTDFMRSGFIEQDWPKSVFPTVVGRLKTPVTGGKNHFVGDEANSKRSTVNLSYPIKNREITNMDDMEKIYHSIFYNELKVCPEEQNVLISEYFGNLKANREKTAQLMFEIYDVPNFYLVNEAVMAIHAGTIFTGTVVDMGEHLCRIVPMKDGIPDVKNMKTLPLGGMHITDHMVNLLAKKGHVFTMKSERMCVQDMKQSLGYVALDPIVEGTKLASIEKEYEMPDMEIIKLSDERFKGAEALFNPSSIGVQSPGIHQLIHDALSQVPETQKKNYYGRIKLTGGTSMFAGIEHRLEKELKILAPNENIKVQANQKRNYINWQGGSLFGSLLGDKWVSKKEFAEHGVKIFHEKCPLY